MLKVQLRKGPIEMSDEAAAQWIAIGLVELVPEEPKKEEPKEEPEKAAEPEKIVEPEKPKEKPEQKKADKPAKK